MRRLLNINTLELPDQDELRDQQELPYVILSHAWQRKEVTFDQMPQFNNLQNLPPWKQSADKIIGACEAVRDADGRLKGETGGIKISHLWMDTVCIDKKNLTELSEAINSMYRWYKQANSCFVYLEDFPSGGVNHFTQSRWFERGWTLQELVAPEKVIFFDSKWNLLGKKETLQEDLSSRTKIDTDFLLHRRNVGKASISQRMSWYSGRSTTVPEDQAYCLTGLFGINIPLLYGEGRERAFRRLQEEIMRYSDDHSLFAWKSTTPLENGSGLLAKSPDFFQDMGSYEHNPERENNKSYEMTNKGISIDLGLQIVQDVYVANISCMHGTNHYLGIWLECVSVQTQQYRRIRTNELCRILRSGRGRLFRIFVKPPDEV